MSHQLDFEKLVEYDPGKAGISFEVNLKLVGQIISVSTKIDTGSTKLYFYQSDWRKAGFGNRVR